VYELTHIEKVKRELTHAEKCNVWVNSCWKKSGVS